MAFELVAVNSPYYDENTRNSTCQTNKCKCSTEFFETQSFDCLNSDVLIVSKDLDYTIFTEI